MIKGFIVTNKRGKIRWNEEREGSQLSAASIRLRFWWMCVHKTWMRQYELFWVSEWDEINFEVKAFCE